jgi:hypothetical protein
MKCIRYSVDPTLLNAGIPIEQLEKKNAQDFPYQETIEHLNRYAQGTKGLYKEKTALHFPKPPEYLEIELSPDNYTLALAGKLIKISPEHALHQGKKFKIVNQVTGSFALRVLIVVSDRGYWQ